VSTDELVVVEVAGTEGEAELLCSLLASAGIRCARRQTNYGAGAFDGMPGGPQEVIVHAEDLESAREVLREVPAEEGH
jgi:Putative prokaryotic signal transducing protein